MLGTTGSEAREIAPPACYSLESLRTGQVPLISSKTVSSAAGTNLLLGRLGSISVPKGAAGAPKEVKESGTHHESIQHTPPCSVYHRLHTECLPSLTNTPA